MIEKDIYIKNRNYRIYTCNERYFNEIDTSEKAYWLGFLYADGNIRRNNEGGWIITLALKKSDRDHLVKFRDAIQSTNKIKTSNHLSVISIFNVYMGNQLIKKGVVPRKTFKLKFPSIEIIPKKFIYSFILGFFDGDGYITYELDDRNNNTQFTIGITGTKDMLKGIINSIDLSINLRREKRYSIKNQNTWEFSVRGNFKVKKFLDKLYKDAPVYLNRKYQNYKLLVKMIESGKKNILPKSSPKNSKDRDEKIIYRIMKRHNWKFIEKCTNGKLKIE